MPCLIIVNMKGPWPGKNCNRPTLTNWRPNLTSTPPPMKQWQKRKQLLTRRGLIYSLLLCILIMGLGGAGFWVIELRAVTLADGL